MRKLYKAGAILLFVMAAAYIAAAYKEVRPYRESKETHTKLQDLVVDVQEPQSPAKRSIDFTVLQGINPDIAAWIYIPGTAIDYPVLIGKTDGEYLKKDYQKSYSPLGSIFAFSDTDREMQNAHICLFGHNMKRPQMFGELKRYSDHVFTKEHENLYLYLPDRTEFYQICSMFVCEKNDGIFEHKMQAGSQEMERLWQQIIDRSEWEMSSVNPHTVPEKIVTLTACRDVERTHMRTTVHFRKIETYGRK